MKMEREIAERLVELLSHHVGIIPMGKMNRAKFIELLTSIDINPASGKFYVELPDDDKYKVLLQESRKYYYLSIRRILININADYDVSLVKKIFGNLISKIGWSSNVYSRSLRLNAEISKILTKSESQFSLLAKLEVYDYDNKEETLFRISNPILVVPNTREDEIEVITEWEIKNTLYEREISFLFFRYLKRSNFTKYITCS